ncbi:RagB/SusD family nutrient uptake outer membrane protein [Cyclobacterium sp.]|uniref:RagB/SusD family nutrient uptake outer membrane protein n=1 Tax=Cyclobacterium sp. TaxID=1966343 RepID=UPI0019AD60F9|nr:RagB/SusD family nutrient uptake outer membrane protein [Cyclobacterium sp.]MBD3627824.1 RagB/SusD family nutrient uptake outer membrane protein [Cyclobacterium sp.]
MKNSINKYIFRGLIAGAVLLGSSCTDYLELEPVSTITTAGFWVNEDNANGALQGMYVRFRDQAAYNLFVLGEARSETLSYGLQASEGRERYFENSIDPNFAGPNWLRLYTVIHDANLIIKYVPDIAFTREQDKNRMLGEAYAMRAFLYFTMAKTWGAVPLVTEPTEGYDAESTFRSRTGLDEIFAQIKSDIERALELLPADIMGSSRAVWSAPAVNTLKGDVYLWTGKVRDGGAADFQTALSALNEVAGMSELGLMENYDDIFRYDQKGNQEVLFAVRFLDLESGTNYNNELYIRDDQIPSGTPDDIRETIGAGGGLNRWAPSLLLREAFEENDQRKDASFVSIFLNSGDGVEEHYASVVRKYRGFVDPSGRRFIDDIVIYRYAEVLLLTAEAKNALGQDPSAEINQIRQRAYGDQFSAFEYSDSGQEANDEAILQERMLELAFEGKRWFDLVRFDKAFERVPSLQNRSNERHLLLWPISLGTISLNSKIEQNPGYGN